MTKNVSNKQAFIKKAIVLPILTGLLFLLCAKTVAQTTIEKKPTIIKSTAPNGYYDKTTFKIKDEKGNVAAEKKYKELTPAEKKIIPLLTARTREKMDSIIKRGSPKTIEIDLYDPKNIKIKKGENDIYSTAGVSENPEYPGGIDKFYTFIGKNFQIPKTPDEGKLKGKIYTTFVIEKDGSLSNYKILRDIGYGTGEEAIRVLKLCPNWNPGKINGEPVRTMYSLPITIQTASKS